MPPKMLLNMMMYHQRLQRHIIMELDAVSTGKYTNKDELNAGIQKLRQKIGEWHNFNLHHSQSDDRTSIKIIGKYNKCPRVNGYDSKFELDDNENNYSDFSSAESIVSDKDEINDVKADINPCNDIVEKASNSKDNPMEIEHSIKNVNPTDINTNDNSDDIKNNGIGDDHINSVIVNNCDAINKSKGKMPDPNANENVMNIDPPVSNVNNMGNDGYQTQGRKRGRVPSNETIPSKKLTRSNSLLLQNKFNVFANLPDSGSNQDQTNEVSQTKTPQIPPVTMKKPVNYR
ncbi:hypothetical protein AVEN_89026-1 [Araneus ventricosus]|uniref:Uncharacterized protein n=1 Tax=Araneus ventricosus TaxID=182803 RepID=A0A4Y2HFT4_ARAVE|nr:hypothetical protein AVEN_89026-1 [Araneus ventricosus]